MIDWKFFGREDRLAELKAIFNRRRWFFVKIAGRRRIGKTTLVQKALEAVPGQPIYYVQIPDSDETGVIAAMVDAMDTFELPEDRFARPRTLIDLAKVIESMARNGYIIVLDEFQYFQRKPFSEFCSLLQAAVDRMSAEASRVRGGLIVLGSLHTEMMALLEDRSAPLYGRVTDSIDLPHLDLAGVLGILDAYADRSPARLLFLWSLFEGVPKYYRDAYEENVLGAERTEVIRRLFFESSSPLRSEADTWFLRELRGRNDMILKFIARRPGLMKRDLEEQIKLKSGEEVDQVSRYLVTLQEKYRLVERKEPIFSAPGSRRGRYYVADNFLQAWLAALSNQVAARQFRPLPKLLAESDDRLAEVEGFALEKLVRQLYQERSRKGLTGFSLTTQIDGYWDKGDIEIDLVAVNEEERVVRFGSCKRNPKKLLADVTNFSAHVRRFLELKPEYADWSVERVGIAPKLGEEHRQILEPHGIIPQDLNDLTGGL
jgi:hypothetical protein